MPNTKSLFILNLTMITPQLLEKAMTYPEYRTLLETLMAEGKTTGADQSEFYLQYAKINLQRMHRLEKTTVIGGALKKALSRLSSSYIWLVITEGWCGDAAQNVPVMHAVEKECEHIQLKLILRDEHLDIMDQYLTSGARSIPKLICLEKETLKERFVWGPRPAAIQEVVLQLKKENKTLEEKGLITQNWYNADKTQSMQMELLSLVQNL
jgi:hypothetical protein